MQSHTIMTLVFPGRPTTRVQLLLASLRAFGGRLANSPVWVLFPSSLGEIDPRECAAITDLGGELIPFETSEESLNFPFSAKVHAAAAAEGLAERKTDLLTWLDPDTLILAEPEEFLLPEDISLGYRPVHHKLLGTAWGQEPGPFWKLIYQHCQASLEKDFPMTTHVGEQIRPYFNAGSFVIRPGRGILRRWLACFNSCLVVPEILAFCEKEDLYAIFLHQVVFTAVLLHLLPQGEMQLLSSRVNYPLHLHQDVPSDLRPDRIDDLISARFENILSEPSWQNELPISKQLASWIETHFRLNQ